MVTSTNISLIKFVLAILTEFCSKSSAYDANFVKRHLINLKIVKVLYLQLIYLMITVCYLNAVKPVRALNVFLVVLLFM